MNNRYLKPKEAICSVCGDKIKVGEKYALGTLIAYKYNPITNTTDRVGVETEIFCGFCKPLKNEYEKTMIYEDRKLMATKDEWDKMSSSEREAFCYGRYYVHSWIEKHLDFYRNKKEVEES